MFVDYPKYEATEGSPPDVPLYSMQSGIGIYDHIWSYNNIYAFISVLLNAECAKFIQIGTSHLDTPQRWHDGLCLFVLETNITAMWCCWNDILNGGVNHV